MPVLRFRGISSSDLTREVRRAYSASQEVKMEKIVSHIIFVLVMAAIIVAVDLLFFRHQAWYRLIVNIGIVLVALAFYFRFLK